MKTLSAKNLGLALGILMAVFTFLFGIVAMVSGYWMEAVDLWGKFYLGFEPTFPGSIVGGVWGFVDGFVGGWLIAWLYNKMQK